jgi:hypothetical protein
VDDVLELIVDQALKSNGVLWKQYLVFLLVQLKNSIQIAEEVFHHFFVVEVFWVVVQQVVLVRGELLFDYDDVSFYLLMNY